MRFESHWNGEHGFVAAFIDDTEVGLLTLRDADGKSLHIVFIHVEEAHRRKGVGTAMAVEGARITGRTSGVVDLITGMGRSIAVSEKLSEEIPGLDIEIRD